MKKQPGFRVDGKPVEIHSLVPLEQRVRKYLDSLPFGDLVTAETLMENVVASPSVRSLIAKKLPQYLYGSGKGYNLRFGNRATIKALRARLGE